MQREIRNANSLRLYLDYSRISLGQSTVTILSVDAPEAQIINHPSVIPSLRERSFRTVIITCAYISSPPRSLTKLYN